MRVVPAFATAHHGHGLLRRISAGRKRIKIESNFQGASAPGKFAHDGDAVALFGMSELADGETQDGDNGVRARNIGKALFDDGGHAIHHHFFGASEEFAFVKFVEGRRREREAADLREHGGDFDGPAFANLEMVDQFFDDLADARGATEG